jgi:hypothetical protein
MAQTVKTKTENQWKYQRVFRKVEKKNVGYYHGQVFTY